MELFNGCEYFGNYFFGSFSLGDILIYEILIVHLQPLAHICEFWWMNCDNVLPTTKNVYICHFPKTYLTYLIPLSCHSFLTLPSLVFQAIFLPKRQINANALSKTSSSLSVSQNNWHDLKCVLVEH